MQGVFHVHCHDEGQPYVGSGHRMVVATVGHKWVHMKELSAPINSHRKKVRRDVWDTLNPNLIERIDQ